MVAMRCKNLERERGRGKLGDNRWVHFLDCGDRFMVGYMCQNVSHFKYVLFIAFQLYFNKKFKKLYTCYGPIFNLWQA